jgi:hypothetical protein
MMPPEEDEELTPPTGDVAPYPHEALDLGAGRWLLNTGEVVTKLKGFDGVDLAANTLSFWEAAAIRGGSTLDDLIV